MAHKRGAHTCTVGDGQLVAIGGWDGAKCDSRLCLCMQPAQICFDTC